MIADEYRRRAIQAEGEAARAIDRRQQTSFIEIANHWRGLADQLEWLESRFGPAVTEFRQGYAAQPAIQQQQQIQPSREDE